MYAFWPPVGEDLGSTAEDQLDLTYPELQEVIKEGVAVVNSHHDDCVNNTSVIETIKLNQCSCINSVT